MIGAESRVEFARVTGSGAEQRIFEFLHDLVRTDDDGNTVTAAAFEFDAFDLAGEVHGHAIGGGRGAGDFVEHRTLLAQRIDHGIEVLVGDACHRALDVDLAERRELHFGQHLEDRGVLQIRARVHRDRFDARATGRIELLASNGLGERRTHEVVDDLAVHLLTVLLPDHRQRRLAGTKALESRGARNLVQPLRHFAIDLRRGNRDF